MGLIGYAYKLRFSSKEPRGKKKGLVETSFGWCNKEWSFWAFWQKINLSIEDVDLTTDASVH